MAVGLNSGPSDPESILDITLARLEIGLQIRHIATFSIRHCAPDAQAGEVLADSDMRPFDHIPVLDDGRCLGVLRRSEVPEDRTVRDQMLPLHDGMLVAADMPILQFMSLMDDAPYRLVVDGTRVRGIVTRSDLLKLPVRVVVFALVTHLEMIMASVIAAAFGTDEAWLKLLGGKRRDGVIQKMEKLKGDGLDPSHLACTDFCDKRDILAKELKRANIFSSSKAKRFTSSLKKIERVRNTLAHAGEYAHDQAELHTFLDTVGSTQDWIRFLEEHNHKGR